MVLLVAKAFIAEAGSFRYSYVYDTVIHLCPDLVDAAREISEDRAVDDILLYLLRDCLAYPVAEIGRLFGWEPWRVERGIARLEKRGAVATGVQVQGDDRPYAALKG